MLVKKEKKNTSMLEGSLWDKILFFAIPLALSSILQQLFNSADVAVVGKFAGSAALAAVGANGPVINLIVGMFTGLSVGTNVVIAIYIGQNRKENISKAVHTSVMVAVICGTVIAVLGQFVARPVLQMMSTPEDIMAQAVLYLKIYMVGMPFIMLYNFEAAVLRSKGDTRRPLLALIVSGIVNLILNLFFVVVCHMNVEGVAIATTVSNIISSMILMICLIREEENMKLRWSEMRIDSAVLKQIAKIGVPAGLQSVVFSISNVLIQSALNGLGATAIAASAAALNFEYFTYYLLAAFGQAAVTFIGQNYGAGNWKRCVRTVRWSLLLGGVATLVMTGAFLVFDRESAGFFTSDPQVLEMALTRMRFTLTFELLNVTMEVLAGSMRGLGYSLAPTLACVGGVCGVRIVWLLTAFAHSPNYETLLAVYPVSWALTVVLLAIIYFVVKKKACELLRQRF